MLQLKDTRYNDVRLIFDEPTHKYTDTFGNSYVSTTTILGKYKEAFDKEYWLNKKARELNTTKKALAKEWQTITTEACDRGNVFHNSAEDGIRDSSMFKKAV